MACGTTLVGDHVGLCSECVGRRIEDVPYPYVFTTPDIMPPAAITPEVIADFWKDEPTGLTIRTGSIMPYWSMINNTQLVDPKDTAKVAEHAELDALLTRLTKRFPNIKEQYHTTGIIPVTYLPWYISEDALLDITSDNRDSHPKSIYFGDRYGWSTPIPSRHPWNSHTTIQECDEASCPTQWTIRGLVVNHDGIIYFPVGKLTTEERRTLMPYTAFPLPRHPTVIASDTGKPEVTTVRLHIITMDPFGTPFGKVAQVITTSDAMDPKDYDTLVRRGSVHYHRHYARWFGKSVNKHSFARGAPMTKLVTDADGTQHREYVRCQHTFRGKPCGGRYLLLADGSYACEQCGIIFDFEADVVATELPALELVAPAGSDTTVESVDIEADADEVPSEDDSEEEQLMDSDDDTGLVSLYQGEQEVGSLLPPELRHVEDRLDRRIKEWKAANTPATTPRRKPRKSSAAQDDVYGSTEKARLKDARKAFLMHRILHDHVTQVGDLLKCPYPKLGMDDRPATLHRLLKELEDDGRILIADGKRSKVITPVVG
jgi:hypothetical protein